MSQSVTAINITSFGPGSGFVLPTAGTNDAQVSGGNLILTQDATSEDGIAVYQTPFSASGSVSFDFTYNSSGGSGADGTSFFLLNGNELTGGPSSVSPGGYGGGLGYSDDGQGGITDGWLGLGFDTFGNYAAVDHGQTAAPGSGSKQPNTIGVRGQGSGTSGYAWLTGQAYAPGIDGTRQVQVTLNDGTGPSGTPQETLTVRVSADGGSTWTTPISNFAISQTVPGSLYFGFAASTGGSTDLHEIEAVKDSQLAFGPVAVTDTTTGASNPATLSPGDGFSYTTTLFNNNTSAISVTLGDALPPNAINLTWTVKDGNTGQTTSGTGPIASQVLAMSSGDTDTITVTGTIDPNASSGDLYHTMTATSAASGSNPSQTVSAAITAGGASPTITTIGADHAVSTSDQASVSPFGYATLYDGDTSGTVTLTVTLANPALGALSSAGASYNASTGTLTYSGTPTQAQAALQAVVFQPVADAGEIGSAASSAMTVSVSDSGSGQTATDSRASVTVTYADTGATITSGGVGTTSGTAAHPFLNTSVADANTTGMTVSVAVQGDASGTEGSFTNTAGWTTSTSGNNLVYTTHVAAQTNIGAAVTSALQSLAFLPPTGAPPGTQTVEFAVTTTDDAGATASGTVPLTVTTPHVGPTGHAGASVSTSDEQAASPFAAASFSDPDNLGTTLSVTIPGAAGGTVGDFGNRAGWTRTVSGNDVTYTLQIAAQPNAGAAATAALQALSFQPAAHVMPPGQTSTVELQATLADTQGDTASLSQTLAVTAAEDAPTITAAAPAGITDEQTAAPFAGTVVTDPDDTGLTLAVSFNGAEGDFSNAVGWTRTVSGSTVTYTLALPAQADAGAAATTALQALTFQPAAHTAPPGTTTQDSFATTLTDSSGASATATLALPVLATQDPIAVTSSGSTAGGATSTGSGTTSGTGTTGSGSSGAGSFGNGESTYDVQPTAPFANYVVTDPDDQSLTARVVVSGAADAATGDLTPASAAGWTRTVSGADAVYTQVFAAQPDVGDAVQTALRALRFMPARLDPGTTASVGFSASITPAGSTTTELASTSVSVTGALRPYLDLAVADSNPTDTVTVAATLPSAAIGNYAALGIGSATGNTYDITGTPDQVTADLHALAFLPTAANGTLPGNYSAVAVSSVSNATLVDIGAGDDTLVASAPDATAYGGSGNDVLVGSAQGSVLVGGGGSNTFLAHGADTVVAGTGTSTIFAGTGSTSIFAQGQSTVVGGAGAMGVYAASSSATTVFGGQSGLTFIGNGAATVIGAAGTNEVYGGPGKLVAFGAQSSSGTFWGGAAGGNVLVAGGGATTLVGVSSGDTLVAQNAAADAIVAGSGNEVIQSSGSAGDNTYFAGSGNDLIALGNGHELVIGGTGNATVSGGTGTMVLYAGSGQTLVNGSTTGGDTFVASSGSSTIWGGAGTANTYDVVAGHAGGVLTVDDFRVGTDHLNLSGYTASDLQTASANAATTATGTLLTLTDGSRINLVGLSHTQAGSLLGS